MIEFSYDVKSSLVDALLALNIVYMIVIYSYLKWWFIDNIGVSVYLLYNECTRYFVLSHTLFYVIKELIKIYSAY